MCIALTQKGWACSACCNKRDQVVRTFTKLDLCICGRPSLILEAQESIQILLL